MSVCDLTDLTPAECACREHWTPSRGEFREIALSELTPGLPAWVTWTHDEHTLKQLGMA